MNNKAFKDVDKRKLNLAVASINGDKIFINKMESKTQNYENLKQTKSSEYSLDFIL